MTILLAGGAGYIGSHTAVALLACGYRVVIIDNLSNSTTDGIEGIREITGKPVTFYRADIRDQSALDHIMATERPEAVIHFAGLKAVGESVERPLEYYGNNFIGTHILCTSMAKHGVKRLIFSSSATVYGDVQAVPIPETALRSATNPYGRTKLMIEDFLQDLAGADPQWSIIALRYFNPIGAHESGLIGENPLGVPNNLMPYICQVAAGEQHSLRIFGNDYPTPDGTGIRDYIHVMDLARGHVKALETAAKQSGWQAYNLGSGIGHSVIQVIRTFETATGISVPWEVVPRRAGDIAVSYADPSKANQELDWCAEYTLEDMCRHAWHWHALHKK